MHLPGVSVIIPTYNHAHYLPQAVGSVVAQTFSAWELIIVDDGSTDDSAAVAAELAEPRIRTVSQANQGLSAARNMGIRHAQGAYLAFLDADDAWEANFLARCLQVLQGDPSLAGVVTGHRMIDENGNLLPQAGGLALPAAEFRGRIVEGGFFPPHAAVTRAATVREVGAFDTQLTSVEDLDLWLRISAHHAMQAIPDRLARYRVYPGSMSTDVGRMHANYLRVLEKNLGAAQGNPAGWPEEKRRAYGCAYRFTALGFLQQGQDDQAWQMLGRAVAIWPQVLARQDTFFEIACGAQPRGYRGTAQHLDRAYDPGRLLQRLGELLAIAHLAQTPLATAAHANACLALSQVRALAGDRAAQRAYLLTALRWQPRLLADPAILRRLGRAMLGAGRR